MHSGTGAWVKRKAKTTDRQRDQHYRIGGVDGVGFVSLARAVGARTLEINLNPSACTSIFAETRHSPAGTLVPAIVTELLDR